MPLESCDYYLKKYSGFSTFLMMLYLTSMNAPLLNESPTRIPLSDNIKCLMMKNARTIFLLVVYTPPERSLVPNST